MNKLGMLLLAAIMAVLVVIPGIAFADEGAGKSVSKTIGGLEIELVTPSGGTVVGANLIGVHLKDVASGKPIVRESVRLELVMDDGGKSMQGMQHGNMSSQKPMVASLAPSPTEAGKYTGSVNFTDAGNWKTTVVVDPGRPDGSIMFGVQVADKTTGPNWGIIGGFLGILAAVVLLALVMKNRNKRPVAAQAKAPGAAQS